MFCPGSVRWRSSVLRFCRFRPCGAGIFKALGVYRPMLFLPPLYTARESWTPDSSFGNPIHGRWERPKPLSLSLWVLSQRSESIQVDHFVTCVDSSGIVGHNLAH